MKKQEIYECESSYLDEIHNTENYLKKKKFRDELIMEKLTADEISERKILLAKAKNGEIEVY